MHNSQITILGVDEVGRGPLAGPVIAAALILHRGHEKILIKDSKKLSALQIKSIAREIASCSTYAIAAATTKEIEELNILQATMLAMRRAIMQIKDYYSVIHVDGNSNPCPDRDDMRLIVGGDNVCRSIAAASIVAKSYRDSLMECLHLEYPQYEWNRNKGYGTKNHIEKIKMYGLVEEHRATFCRRILKSSDLSLSDDN